MGIKISPYIFKFDKRFKNPFFLKNNLKKFKSLSAKYQRAGNVLAPPSG